MMSRWIGLFLLFLLIGLHTAAFGGDVQIRALKPGARLNIDRITGDDKALVSVFDAGEKPILGLGVADFAVTEGRRTAKITSVQPIAESLEVPRHIVLVLDNSSSMRERNAIKPLLEGVDELLKILRPIDQVHVVVFDNNQAVKMAGRDLHVRTFKSSNPAELKNFIARTYRDGITPTTMLYEGILAGLDITRTLPVGLPKFLVIFSDGEDINSAFKQDVVAEAAKGVAGFDAYAIDFMPGPQTDKFLSEFADQNRGRIWKATSEANLVPIFQNVASKMQYSYVITYIFPATGSLAVSPASLSIDEVNVGGRVTSSIDASQLTVRPTVDSAYGIERWKLTVANAAGTVAELAGEGSPAKELNVPLPTDNLGGLAAGGDLKATMEVQDRKGQALTLTSVPVKVNALRTTASLAVSPASVTIEEVKTIDTSPMLAHVYFARGSSEIPEKYVRLAGSENTAGFDEQKFRDMLEKHYQVLNIIGQRMTDNPAAAITLVGCNDNTGAEKGNKKLSAARAEAVKSYLQTTWKIAPERIKTEARNLPEKPSTSRLDEGQADNRRVEIISADAAILKPILSIYPATRIDTPLLMLRPEVVSPHGIARWKLTVSNSGGMVAEMAGEGAPATELNVPLPTGNLNALAQGGDMAPKMELQDRQGQTLVLSQTPIKVNFLQTSRRLTQKEDVQVQEKYALILFDFDSDVIDARNREIVNTIAERIRKLPEAAVEVVGHTDNIGKEGYNIKLSERRASAVHKMLTAADSGIPGERIRYRGVGPREPLYDNTTSERRAFNRTVTITLEYRATE